MSEEIGARMRAESRVVEVEKQCSMLEFDLKQSVQKMEQLMKQKERLEDEACILCYNLHEYNDEYRVFGTWRTRWSAICHIFQFQVKSLRIQGEQELSKRALAQSELKSRMQEVDRLRCSEKQLKQEINTALEGKRSLEFQLAQLTKWVPSSMSLRTDEMKLRKNEHFYYKGYRLFVMIQPAGGRWAIDFSVGR